MKYREGSTECGKGTENKDAGIRAEGLGNCGVWKREQGLWSEEPGAGNRE